MKKILIMFLIVLICLFIADVIYQANNTKVVLLSGDIMGFEIENYNTNNQNGNIIPTSAQKLGVVTFIKKDTHEFSALGHPAMQNSEGIEIKGICREVSIDKIDKSYQNHIGYIHGTLDNVKKIGIVNKNNQYGIFGKIYEIKDNNYNEIETASKYEIRLGEAELVISLENEKLQTYKIEIIAINYMSNNKNIKIRIQDDELITKTGGIVQGMSGAPIIQNGKLIGAINYANSEEPEDAYAIFIDKLM